MEIGRRIGQEEKKFHVTFICGILTRNDYRSSKLNGDFLLKQ